MGRIPLAWLQLVHEKLRLLAALAGIAFAAMLMLMQLGFRDALFDSSTLVHDRLRADLVVLSPMYEYIASTRSFTQRGLYEALAVEGVESVAPLYIGLARWKNPETMRETLVLAMGVDVSRQVFEVPGVIENAAKIRVPDLVLVDTKTRPEFGPIADLFGRDGIVQTELNGRKITVSGLFDLGTSFGVNATVIMSDTTFLRVFPDWRDGMISLGLITVKKGADPQTVMTGVSQILPPDARVMTLDAYSKREQAYWDQNSPIGFIFNLGTLLGLVVGAVIVYQILYTDVTDHLAEYATLKAMGYQDRRLFWIVFQEALILSILGFIPGFIVAQVLYIMTNRATFLPVYMTVERALAVLLLTVLMCCGAGALAMRKLRSADPAEVF